MSQRTFSLTGAIVFLLIAIVHLLRTLFGTPVVVHGVAVPVWASLVAALVTGFLSYEGFRFARKFPPKR